MSQYSISLNAIIGTADLTTFGDFEKKIDVGRKLLFNYNYGVDDEEFKRLFERGFIIDNITNDICFYDVDRWKAKLKNDVELKAKLYYKQYEAVQLLKADCINDMSTTISTASGNVNAKIKNSTFPQDINANNFEDVKYMDSGNATDQNSSAESTITVKGNTLDKINRYNKMLTNVIENFIRSFDNLFYELW